MGSASPSFLNPIAAEAETSGSRLSTEALARRAKQRREGGACGLFEGRQGLARALVHKHVRALHLLRCTADKWSVRAVAKCT